MKGGIAGAFAQVAEREGKVVLDHSSAIERENSCVIPSYPVPKSAAIDC